jgi:hypothetical protein
VILTTIIISIKYINIPLVSDYMKFFINIVQSILKKELPRPLGRWRIEDCHLKINNRVDLSNEDHCGPCGKYALEKVNDFNKQIQLKDNKNELTIYRK